MKPTPSIAAEQDSVDLASEAPAKVNGLGRFDRNFAPRAAVVAEAMTAIVLADALLKAGLLHPVRMPETAE